MNPRLGESSLGAVVGATTGSFCGLVALGIPLAILTRDSEALFATPILSIISWLLSAIAGWLIGGQIGPRLESLLGERNGSVAGGIIGGVMAPVAIALWSWYMITRH